MLQMASTVVFKVKHEDTLRRFNARVTENQLMDLDIAGLRAKIRSLFEFSADADLKLTYVDEDHDMVDLVDEEDLHDVVKQALEPVRITVKLKTAKTTSSASSGSSTASSASSGFSTASTASDAVNAAKPVKGRSSGQETAIPVVSKPLQRAPMAPLLGSRFTTAQPWAPRPQPPFPVSGGEQNPVRPKLDNHFMMDGTVMAPKTKFTKIWRLRNSGSIPWARGFQFVWVGGDKFSNTDSVQIQLPAAGFLHPEGEVEVAVDFTAPELPGQYISFWKVADPSGLKFGQRAWHIIQVDETKNDASSAASGGLNLKR